MSIVNASYHTVFGAVKIASYWTELNVPYFESIIKYIISFFCFDTDWSFYNIYSLNRPMTRIPDKTICEYYHQFIVSCEEAALELLKQVRIS